MNYPMIKANGAMHGGFGESQGGSPPHWLGHVAVEDADETAEKVKAGGGTIYYGPSDIPEVGRFFIFADPQGAVLSAFASSGPPQGPPGRGRVRLGRAGDERHRRRQEVLRRRLRLDVPRHGHGRRDDVLDLRAPRRRRRRRAGCR